MQSPLLKKEGRKEGNWKEGRTGKRKIISKESRKAGQTEEKKGRKVGQEEREKEERKKEGTIGRKEGKKERRMEGRKKRIERKEG